MTTDVFLLCFSISSLSSLCSATTNWIAALSAQFTDTPFILVGCQSVKKRSKFTFKRDCSSPRLTGCTLNCLTPGHLYHSHPLTLGSKTASLSCVSLQSKSSTLSSTNSGTSGISISSYKTPLVTTRMGRKGKEEEMITIKCQRLNSDKKVEEVDIEVPSNIFNNIERDNDRIQNKVNSIENNSLGSKLKRLILREL
jgi:hypothetical protein